MKKAFRFVLKTILYIVSFIILYILLGVLLPMIGISAKETNEPKTVSIFLLTNGVHSDLVLPIHTEYIRWDEKIPFTDVRSQSSNYKWIAFAWGDKGFYLNTPTWTDLKFSTAFKAAFGLSDSAMHCTFYDSLEENKDCIKINLTENQYKKLVQYIDNKFDKYQNGNYIFIPTDAVYSDNDAFYEAKGTYSFLYTCNTWANYGLKAAEQSYALWTPTDFGIFRHYKK
ncbi:MAG: TIGR02117 family protein [Capnocytophaga sp.]|nr:TIGR02117 family protein [Capnocytophaga sp.]